MLTTKSWAETKGLDTNDQPEPIPDYSEKYAQDSQQIARRTVILTAICAIAYQAEPAPIVAWLEAQGLQKDLSPKERRLLENPNQTEHELRQFHWRSEALWTLLWTIGKIECLGLPIRQADTARLVDSVMPALGDNITRFVESASLHEPGLLLESVSKPSRGRDGSAGGFCQGAPTSRCDSI
ncbi:MAG: DUF4272 domain-containing protein, partial [Planctomycetota bacterium]